MAVSAGSPDAGWGTSGGCIAPPPPGSTGPTRFARRVMPGATGRFVAFTEQLGSGAPVVSVMGEVDRATARGAGADAARRDRTIPAMAMTREEADAILAPASPSELLARPVRWDSSTSA
jgi:hypothetical protein